MSIASERPATTSDAEQVSLLQLIQLVRQRFLAVVLIFVVFVAAALLYALLATPKYRAEIVVREAERNGVIGGAGALTGQLGGLASLAGINLGALGANRDALPVLRSRLLIQQFIDNRNLQSQVLRGSSEEVTPWRAVLAFQRNIAKVTEDKRKGVVTLSITWRDPAEAADWANGLVALVNQMLRTRDKADAERSLRFLNSQLSKTNIVEVQRAIYALIENEMKTLMLTDAREDYALVVVDPAVPPELRHSPRRTLIVIIGAALGGIAGLGYVTGIYMLRRSGFLRAAGR